MFQFRPWVKPYIGGFTKGGKLPLLKCFLFVFFAVKTPNEWVKKKILNLLCVSINTKLGSSNV